MNDLSKSYMQVAHHNVVIKGHAASYFLYKSRKSHSPYLIKIDYRDESCEGLLAFDALSALNIFSILIKNTVTPCSFYDVIEDLN